MRIACLAAAVAVAASSNVQQVLAAPWSATRRDVDPSLLYPAHNFTTMPVDHFHNESKYAPHSSGTFNNRYWFDDTYYKPGGPVFLIITGESNGDYRLPILQNGIAYQFNKAFGGLGVVIEHRYFGRSQPTANLTTENYRFLSTDQALADTAYFAQHIVFPGHEHENMTASARPWITYGGSYAGAFVAFLRTQYPGVFWGSISSSGVTKSIWDYWQYFNPIIQYGPQPCISNTQKLTHMVDNIITGNKTRPNMTEADAQGGDKALIQKLKSAFSLGSLAYNNDFANTLSLPTGDWQGLEWVKTINDTGFGDFCNAIGADKPKYANTNMTAEAQEFLVAGGYANESKTLTAPLLNYFGYISETYVKPCVAGNETVDECFNTHNVGLYNKTDWDQWSEKSWPYMYCTQWGFLQTGSGHPTTSLPLISRTITLDYLSIICKDGFGITAPPDTNAINSRGGFDIAYERLAIVGGKLDPWRPVTPLAPNAHYQTRANTTDMPLLLISDGVHHWDEYGIFPNETSPGYPPAPIVQVQSQEHDFVKKWLDDAKGKFPAYKPSF